MLLAGRSQYALLPLRSEIHHATHVKLEWSLQLAFAKLANIGVGLTSVMRLAFETITPLFF